MIVILFVALGGVIAGLGTFSSSDDLGYNTMGLLDGAYNTPGGTSAVSHPVSGVALPVSVTSRTLFHHTAVPSYSVMATPALSGGSYAVQGLALTSQGAMNAFGGSGGSASSMESTHTSSQSASYAMGGGSVGGSYRTGKSGGYAASTFSAGTSVNSTFSPAVCAAAPAAPSAINNDFSTWGKTFNTPFVAASEHQTAIGSSWLVSYAANRRYAPPSGDTPYLNWLQNQGESAYLYSDDNGVRYYDINKLREIYEQQFGGTDTPEITWEEFLSWFNSYEYVGVPLSDGCLVMLLLAVGLALYIRKKTKCTRSADISR